MPIALANGSNGPSVERGQGRGPRLSVFFLPKLVPAFVRHALGHLRRPLAGPGGASERQADGERPKADDEG